MLAMSLCDSGSYFPNRKPCRRGEALGNSQAVQADAGEECPMRYRSTDAGQPLKGQADAGKISTMTPGWHEDETGRWYQNADGTYYEMVLQILKV